MRARPPTARVFATSKPVSARCNRRSIILGFARGLRGRRWRTLMSDATGASTRTSPRGLFERRGTCTPASVSAPTSPTRCTRSTPRSSSSVSRCFPGRTTVGATPQSSCTPCWTCVARSRQLCKSRPENAPMSRRSMVYVLVAIVKRGWPWPRRGLPADARATCTARAQPATWMPAARPRRS